MTEYRRYYKLQRYNKDGTPYEPPMYKKGYSIEQHWWPSLESCEANHQIEWEILNNEFICDKTENDTYIKYQKLQAFIDGEPYRPKKFKKGDRVGDEEYSSLIECRTGSSKSGCFSWVNETDYKIKYWINDKEYETTDSPVCIGIPYNSLLFYNPRISMTHSNSNMTSINLTEIDTTELVDMGNMFEGCAKLTELDLSSFDTSAVTNMRWMFSSCSGLTSLNISNFDTSAVTNMYHIYGMFRGCSKLNSITCKQAFKDLCISKQNEINLPDAMREGGSGTWIIVD